jgi:cytochrome c553
MTKWPERIISVLFLGTGIFLYLNTGNKSLLLHIKISLVIASIPLAIVGFKRKKSVLAILSVLLLISAYGLAEMHKKQITRRPKPDLSQTNGPLDTGKALYKQYCTDCHGPNGDAGHSGSKNLQVSELGPNEKKDLIRNGKGAMPGFSQLSEEEIEGILQYTDTFLEK